MRSQAGSARRVRRGRGSLFCRNEARTVGERGGGGQNAGGQVVDLGMKLAGWESCWAERGQQTPPSDLLADQEGGLNHKPSTLNQKT